MKRILALALALVMGLTMSACAQEERYPEIADLLDAGEYENAMLAIYEMYREQNPTAPTEDPVLVRKYNTLVSALESLTLYSQNRYDLSSFSFVHFNGHEHLRYEGMEAVAWLYQTATELGTFENAAEIASRFTVLENVPLEKIYHYTDTLGNINESSRIYYIYDTNGELVSQSPDNGAVTDHYLYNYGTPEYTFDEAGRVTAVRYLSADTVNCVIEYTYNSDGTVKTEHYRDRAGNEYTISHQYKKGVLVRSTGVPYAEGSANTMTVEYQYDEAGNLVLETGIRNSWDEGNPSLFIKTVQYTYDEAGRITGIRKATEFWIKENYSDKDRVLEQYQDVREWTYSYDQSGRLTHNSYAVIGTTDPNGNPLNGSYRTYTGETRYGSYYVYTPAATDVR